MALVRIVYVSGWFVLLLLMLRLWLQVPCELRLPDLKGGGKGGISLEQQLLKEAEDLLVMQGMARSNQRCVLVKLCDCVVV